MSDAPIPFDQLVTPPVMPVFNFTWPAEALPVNGRGLALPAIDSRLLMVGGFAVAGLVLLMLPTSGRRR